MAYTLEQFCTESRAILKAKPLASALTQVADRLSRLLANPAFVTETFNWVILGGTGAYARLHGEGQGTTVYGDPLTNTYTGRLH